jgi:hypothetical protein
MPKPNATEAMSRFALLAIQSMRDSCQCLGLERTGTVGLALVRSTNSKNIVLGRCESQQSGIRLIAKRCTAARRVPPSKLGAALNLRFLLSGRQARKIKTEWTPRKIVRDRNGWSIHVMFGLAVGQDHEAPALTTGKELKAETLVGSAARARVLNR